MAGETIYVLVRADESRHAVEEPLGWHTDRAYLERQAIVREWEAHKRAVAALAADSGTKLLSPDETTWRRFTVIPLSKL